VQRPAADADACGNADAIPAPIAYGNPFGVAVAGSVRVAVRITVAQRGPVDVESSAAQPLDTGKQPALSVAAIGQPKLTALATRCPSLNASAGDARAGALRRNRPPMFHPTEQRG
jgi:hypothetical protein